MVNTRLLKMTRALALLMLPLIISISASATDLSGQVIEVIDGNTISLKSLSHTIKVRLLAVAPPEPSQPYAEVARQHLTDLILRKFVVVRYTGIGDRGYLVGRILLEQGDVNAQMLRDGVAWYYQPEATNLSEADRELYSACEKAARSERRGLWQDQAPVAPWDFRKSLQPPPPAPKAAATAAPRAQTELPVPRAKRSSLSSEDMLGGALTPGTIAGKPEFKRVSADSTPNSWVRFQPQDKHFSVLAPGDATEVTYPVLDNDGKLSEMKYVFGTADGTVCVLGFVQGPSINASDASAIDAYIDSLLAGINRPLERMGSDYKVTAGFVRNLQLSGYAGKQYRFGGQLLSGVVRVFAKQINGEREFLLLMALNNEGPASDQFLNSLKFAQSR